MTKKKIVIISGIGGVVIAASYVASTINPAVGVVMFAALPFLACPAMCAAMGGAVWLQRRFSKKKVMTPSAVVTKEESCCAMHSTIKNERQDEVVPIPESKHEVDVASTIISESQQKSKKRTIKLEN